MKIAGILYGITGVLFLFTPFYGAFLMLAGIFVFAQAQESEETIHKNRVLLYIISILGITCLIGSILVFVALDELAKKRRLSNGINAPPKVVYKVDKDSRKIDILLKLGVGMVFISGLLFATTSWDFIHNYVKAFALIVFGGLFLGLSLFTEKKLKLYRSSYMYWLLSMSLFLLTIVGILYFGIFGSYLTYTGDGKYLAYAITFLTGAGFALTTYYKFPKKYLLFTCYIGAVLSVASILAYLDFSEMISVAIISVIVMIMNICVPKKGTIHTFSTILSYMLFGFIIAASTEGDWELLIACSINILNLNYLTFIHKREDESIVNILLTYILILMGLAGFTPLGDCNYLMMTLAVSLYTVLINGNVIPTKVITQRLNYLTVSVIMMGLYFITIDEGNATIPFTYLIVSGLHLGMNTMIKHGWLRMESWKVTNFFQPALICGLIAAIVIYFFPDLEFIYVLAILGFVFGLLHFLYKNPLDKTIHFICFILVMLIALSAEAYHLDVIPCLIFVVYALYLFTTTFLKENDTTTKKLGLVGTYVILLSSLYIPFVYSNILDLSIYYPALIFILLVFVIALLLKDEWIKKTSYLYVLLPLTTMIQESSLDYELQTILGSITCLYAIFLVIKFFIKNPILKSVIIIVGVVYALSSVFLLDTIAAAVYVGVVGFLVIIVGYKKDDMFAVFITGIVITVANIIYRLRDVWKQIPFWLYLLVGGLAIIGFVTYHEIKKQSKKQEETKSQ